MKWFALVCAAGMACSINGGIREDNKIVNGITAPSSEYEWDAIARFGPKSLQGTPSVNPSPTCVLISDDLVLLPSDSVYNTSNLLYIDHGGTPQAYFARFRRMSDGMTFADDTPPTPLIYDVDVDVLGLVPLYKSPAAGYILGRLATPILHIVPMKLEFNGYPPVTEDIYIAGYGRTSCPVNDVEPPFPRYLSYYIWNATEDLFAAPDIWKARPNDSSPANCSFMSNLPFVKKGDSGGPTMYVDANDDFVMLAGYGDPFCAISADSQRVLREATSDIIDTGSFAMSAGAAYSFVYTGSVSGCLFPIDSSGLRCNEIASGVSLSGTVSGPGGVLTYSASDQGPNHIVSKSASATPCANVSSNTEGQILGAVKVNGHQDYLQISIGSQQSAEAHLTFASGPSGTLPEAAQSTSIVGVDSSRLYARIPFEVTSTGSMWLKVRMQGVRNEIGGSLPQTKSQGYWIICHDLDGDGILESGERMVGSFGVNQSAQRVNPVLGLEFGDGDGEKDFGYEHIFLGAGHYVIEAGMFTNSKAEVTALVCGASGSDSISVEDSLTLTLEPDAPCGSLDMNLDNFVTGDDFYRFMDIWEFEDITHYPSPDFNRDGFVDFFDVSMFDDVFTYQKSCDGNGTPTFTSVFH